MMGCGAGAGRLRRVHRACVGEEGARRLGKAREGAGVGAQHLPDRPARPLPQRGWGGPREWQGAAPASPVSPDTWQDRLGDRDESGAGFAGDAWTARLSACLMLVPIPKARTGLVLSSPTRPRPQNREPRGSAPFLSLQPPRPEPARPQARPGGGVGGAPTEPSAQLNAWPLSPLGP